MQTKTNLRGDLVKALPINLLGGTLVQPETALHTYLDDSTGKSTLFSWKTVANLWDFKIVPSYDSMKIFHWPANGFS